MKNQLSFL